MAETYDVFISHTAENEGHARRMAQYLRELGASIFLASKSILAGDAIFNVINGAIDGSRAVVVFAPLEGGRPRKWFSSELYAAINRASAGQQLLIPVFTGRADQSVVKDLKGFQGIIADNDEQLREGARRIVDALGLSHRDVSQTPWDLTSANIPPPPEWYIDTGFTEQVVAAVTLMWERGGAPLYVIGMAGVGKTTLVAEACRRLLSVAEIVCWVRARSEALVVSDLGAFGSSLDVPAQLDDESAARAALTYFSQDSTRRSIVVFDEPWDMAQIERWIPSGRSPTATIVTSRESPLTVGANTMFLPPLNSDESVRFLERLTRRNQMDPSPLDSDLVRVAREVGGTPLALLMLANLTSTEGIPAIASFVSGSETPGRLRDQLLERSVAFWMDESAGARIFLSAMAVGSDADLPLSILCASVAWVLASSSLDVWSEGVVSQLRAGGLIETSADGVSMHPLLKSIIRERADNHGIDALLECLDSWLVQLERDGLPGETSLVRTHLAHVLDKIAEGHRSSQLEKAIELSINLSRMLQGQGHLFEATALLERALGDGREILGAESPSALMIQAELAGTYQVAGDLERAVELLEQTLASSERVLGDAHPSTLSWRANLARICEDRGDYQRAFNLFEVTLADSQRILGSDHPSTLAIQADLARLCGLVGMPGRATELLEQTLAGSVRVLGDDHPSTLSLQANLAGMYQARGEYHTAEALLERTLADSRRNLGPDHPSTITVRANLAGTLEGLGDHERAVTLLRETLDDSERILGPDHSSTRAIRRNLTFLLAAGTRGQAT